MKSHVDHINDCSMACKVVPKKEWVHIFIYRLDMILINWYMLLELQRGTTNWDELSNSFKQTCSYVDENPSIDISLQVIKEIFFEEISILVLSVLQ